MPYHLRFLGQPQLLLPNGEESRFRVRKHLALLLYLALEQRGVPHRRERLAELLWPNGTAGEGRHSLATALTVLRGKLGRESLETDRDHVRFTPADLTMDLERLGEGNVLGDDYTPPLTIAGFIEDFDIADATEFQLWRERQWARWLPDVRNALLLLIDRCRRTGAFREMDRQAECLLTLDELSEEGVRARMEARAFEGDRLSALKLYEQWRTRLSEALGAEPSPDLEQMAARLRRRGWERLPAGESPAIRTEQWRGRPFLGRAGEYRRLYELWEETRRGNPSHALVLGDSGVGKTTLIERVMTAAELQGAAVTRVQCYELEQEIPYASLGTLIEGLLRLPGISGTSPEWLAELARLRPEVRQRFPGIPEPPESLGETARLRLAEAAYQLLVTLAEDLPVILVLDDLHLADDATLAVLHLVLRRLDRQRIMMLAAARPAELDRSPNAVRLRNGGRSIRLALLDLPPMSDEESAALLTVLVGEETPPPLAARRAILTASSGFPMVLEHLVRDWQANGERALALSLSAMTEDLAPGDPGGTYRLILERLLRDLDPATRMALGVASVLGSRLNDLQMYALADLALSETMSSLARLTDLRVLRDGSRGLEFCNELLRAEAYRAVPSPLRRNLHGNIADHLLALQAKGETVLGLEIAWHCMRAGRPEEATNYLLSGARQAIRRGGPLEAERALASAFNALEGETQEEARLIWAETLQEQGRWEESLEVLGDHIFTEGTDASKLAYVMRLESEAYTGTLDVDGLSPDTLDLKPLIGIINTEQSLAIRIRAAAVVMRIIAVTGASQSAADLLSAIEGIPDGMAHDDDSSLLVWVNAALRHRAGGADKALANIALAIHRHSQLGGADSLTGKLYNGLGCLLCARGYYAEAIDHLTKAYELASKRDNSMERGLTASNLALCNFRLGHYQQQEEWSDRTSEFLLPTHRNRMFRFEFNLAWALALQGAASKARVGLAAIMARKNAIASTGRGQEFHLLAADVHRALGEHNESVALARTAIPSAASSIVNVSYAGSFARWIALLYKRTCDEELATERLRRMISEVENYDAIDRVEILSAFAWLTEQKHQLRPRIDEGLAGLPLAVSDQLASLGMLPNWE